MNDFLNFVQKKLKTEYLSLSLFSFYSNTD